MTNHEKFEKWIAAYQKRKHEELCRRRKLQHPPREFFVIGADVRKLLTYMRRLHYSESVITYYRRYLNRLDGFYYRNGISSFSMESAEEFIRSDIPAAKKVICKNIINRFQHYLSTGSWSTKRVCKYKAGLLSPELEKLLISYKHYNKKKGNKPLTISKKEKLSREFLRRCNSKSIEDITSEKITDAVINTKNKDEWQYARQFFKFCLETKRVPFEFGALIPKTRQVKKLPSTYSVEEITKVEFTVDRTTTIGKRDYALLLLSTRLGLRSGDIVDLKLSEIDFEQKKIKRIQLKTGNEIELALVADVENALLDYIKNARPKSHSKTVFLRHYAPFKPITTAVLRSGVVKKYILQAEITITNRKHGPHAFRASLATAMVNDTVPFEAVSKVLGHTTKDTIQRYAKLDLEGLRQCALEVAPASGKFQFWLTGGQNG